MKRILLSFCLLAFIALNVVFSQGKLNVDSLTAVLNQYPKEDTVKVKMLIAVAEDLKKNNPEKAIKVVEQAITTSEQTKEDFWIGKAYYTLSDIYFRTGDLLEAKQFCEKSKFYFEKGKYENYIGTSIMRLGSIAARLKDFDTAIKNYEEAVAVFDRTKNFVMKTKVVTGLATVHLNLGKFEKAKEYYKVAIALNERFNDQAALAAIYESLHRLYINLGNYITALEYAQKSIKIFEVTNDLRSLSSVYGSIGVLYFNLDDYQEAQKNCLKALEIFQKINDKNGICVMKVSLAAMHKEPKTLIEEMKKVAEYCIETKNDAMLAYAHQNLAATYILINNFPLSYFHAVEGLTLEKKLKDIKNSIILNNIAANVIINCSDKELIDLKIEPKKRYEKAKEYLSQSLTLGADLFPNERNVTWFRLSEIYEKEGNFTQAYNAYKKYVALKDSTSGDDVKKQITRKEIQYEFDKKETELKYQQQLTANELEKQRLLTFQQGQTLTLKEQALALSNKEKDLVHLAFLKEQAEKQEKEQALLLAQKDKDLAGVQILNLAKEKALQLQELARKNATIGFLGASVLAILLAAALFYLWLKKRQAELQATRQAELQAAFTQQLFAETETERTRIARDLHDGISHELLGLKRTSLPSNSDAAQKIDDVIESIRQISRNLHPVMLDSIGLQLSIESFCEQFAEAHNLFVNYEINYSNELHKNTELQVLRIIQEALTNAAKHANAQAANVSMSDYGNGVLLKIQDNGKGFDVEKALNSGKAFGLQSIIERAKIINTKANIYSTPQGTIIELKIS